MRPTDHAPQWDTPSPGACCVAYVATSSSAETDLGGRCWYATAYASHASAHGRRMAGETANGEWRHAIPRNAIPWKACWTTSPDGRISTELGS